MDGPLAVDAKDISKRYGARWALARLSFTLPQGQSLLLTGHNGSGKTTLLRLLASAARPTFGRISVAGLDSQRERDSVRHHVALLSHASYLYEDLTARENLSLVASIVGADAPLIPPLLAEVGLESRADHSVREFSAGMRKRLAVARLLLQRPKVALLDEPFGELDPAGIVWMEGLIRKLQSEGASVVLATHLVEQGRSLCSQRLHLEQGRAAVAP